MTEQEYLALSPRERDAVVAEMVMGLNIVDRNWPCGHSPDCGAYQAHQVFWGDETPEDAKFTERGPVYLEPNEEWPPQRDPEERIMVAAGVVPVPFYTTEIAAAWLVVERLETDGRTLDLVKSRYGLRRWTAAFDTHNTLGPPGTADTPSLAINMAALKAKGAIT